jgi:hypothetical protein
MLDLLLDGGEAQLPIYLTRKEDGDETSASAASVPPVHTPAVGTPPELATLSVKRHASTASTVIRESQKAALQAYRKKHTISEAAHEKMLARAGWTAAEFERGAKGGKAVATKQQEHQA